MNGIAGDVEIKGKIGGEYEDMATEDATTGSMSMTIQFTFETSGDVADQSEVDMHVAGELSDAFLVPSINIKVCN